MTDSTPILQGLLAALDQRGEPTLVERTFTPEAVAYRLGWGERRGQVDERFDGHAEIVTWMRRSPEGVRFTLASEPEPCEGGQSVRYRIRVADFENQGTWRFTLQGDRIAQLWHQPDDLPGPQPGFHKHD